MRLGRIVRLLIVCLGVAVLISVGGCATVDRAAEGEGLVTAPTEEPGEVAASGGMPPTMFLGEAPTKAESLSRGRRVPVGPELAAAAGVGVKSPSETLGRVITQSVITTFGVGPTAGKRYNVLYGDDLEVTGRAYLTSEAAAASVTEGLDLSVPGVFTQVEVGGNAGVAFSAGSTRSTVTAAGTIPGFQSDFGCVIWSDGPAVYSVSFTGGSRDQVMRVARSMYR